MCGFLFIIIDHLILFFSGNPHGGEKEAIVVWAKGSQIGGHGILNCAKRRFLAESAWGKGGEKGYGGEGETKVSGDITVPLRGYDLPGSMADHCSSSVQHPVGGILVLTQRIIVGIDCMQLLREECDYIVVSLPLFSSYTTRTSWIHEAAIIPWKVTSALQKGLESWQARATQWP